MKRNLSAWIFVLGLLIALPLGVSLAFGASGHTAPIEPVIVTL